MASLILVMVIEYIFRPIKKLRIYTDLSNSRLKPHEGHCVPNLTKMDTDPLVYVV